MKTKITIKSIGHICHFDNKDGVGKGISRDLIIEFTDKETLDREELLVAVYGELAENFQWHEGDQAMAKIAFSVRINEKNERKYQKIYLANLEAI